MPAAWNGTLGRRNGADYLCILPFVRLLSGPMDYTPGIFDINYNRAKADKGRLEWNGPNADCCIKTTIARQIANWVIIYSPLQMASDLIENYDGQPGSSSSATSMPIATGRKLLMGENRPVYIVVARRAGESYFIGAGTDSEARTLELPSLSSPREDIYSRHICRRHQVGRPVTTGYLVAQVDISRHADHTDGSDRRTGRDPCPCKKLELSLNYIEQPCRVYVSYAAAGLLHYKSLKRVLLL